jgi:thiamine-phosphate pyrophosphorylase
VIVPRLIVMSDFSRGDEPVLFARIERALALARAGSVLVVLRDHELSARRRMALGMRLREIAHGSGQHFGVADRADLALALGADALHLGEASVPTADARRLMGEGVFLSRACHDPAQPPRDADAVVLAPILAPRHGRPALGLRALGACTGAYLVALGGIDADSARACLDAGADAIAVIGAVLDHDDPAPLVDALGLLG